MISAAILVGIGLGLIFIMAIVFIAVLMNRADLMAVIVEERLNGELILLLPNAKIKLVKKKGTVESWKIMGTKIPNFKPIDKSHVLTGRKTDWIFLLRDKDGFFHALDPTVDERMRNLVLKPEYRDQIDWLVEETEERAKLKEKGNAFEKYMPTITLVICGFIFFMTCFFGWQFSEKKITEANAVADGLQHKIDAWKTDVESFARIAAERGIVLRTEEATRNNMTIHTVGNNPVS